MMAVAGPATKNEVCFISCNEGAVAVVVKMRAAAEAAQLRQRFLLIIEGDRPRSSRRGGMDDTTRQIV